MDSKVQPSGVTSGSARDGEHVALLTTALDVSGAERVIAHLAHGLADAGYRVSVLALQRRSGDLARLVRSHDIDVVDMGMAGHLDLAVVGRLRRWLVEQQVSVLYTFLFHAHLVGRLAGRMARVPHLISCQQVACWGGPVRRTLDAWTSRWCDRVVAVSAAVHDDLITELRVPADRVSLIHNGVDVSAFQPLIRPFHPRVENDSIVIGSASRFAPEKDHESLVRGFAMARERRSDLRLRLAGRGPLASKLRRLVGELGIESAVEMPGHIENVRQFYDDLDLYVQPSRTEGLPCAVIEAMAMSRPVIATDVPGNRDAVVHNETGWLIPVGSPAAWADAIWTAIDDADRAVRMGEAGRRRAEEVFDVGIMVRRTIDLLEALSGRRASRRQLVSPGICS